MAAWCRLTLSLSMHTLLESDRPMVVIGLDLRAQDPAISE
jgi:hypothetical protein